MESLNDAQYFFYVFLIGIIGGITTLVAYYEIKKFIKTRAKKFGLKPKNKQYAK